MGLGDLSAKYESNGNPATVSTGYGDLGGYPMGVTNWQVKKVQ